MKKQCGFLLLYVVVAVLLLPLLLTILCGGLGQELPQEAQVLYGLADLAPLDTELEEYVAGVVAAEMPAAFPEEALKAQAVAARTYQVRQMQAAGSRAVLYDVGQAYLSEAEQKEKWGEGYALYAGKIHSAVRATAGEIMTYDGEPILAAFHAQSGGRCLMPSITNCRQVRLLSRKVKSAPNLSLSTSPVLLTLKLMQAICSPSLSTRCRVVWVH